MAGCPDTHTKHSLNMAEGGLGVSFLIRETKTTGLAFLLHDTSRPVCQKVEHGVSCFFVCFVRNGHLTFTVLNSDWSEGVDLLSGTATLTVVANHWFILIAWFSTCTVV